MTQTLIAIYDGKTLRFQSDLKLVPNEAYKVTLESLPHAEQESDVWDALMALAGTVEAPADWSAEHDHYLYGTAKRAE